MRDVLEQFAISLVSYWWVLLLSYGLSLYSLERRTRSTPRSKLTNKELLKNLFTPIFTVTLLWVLLTLLNSVVGYEVSLDTQYIPMGVLVTILLLLWWVCSMTGLMLKEKDIEKADYLVYFSNFAFRCLVVWGFIFFTINVFFIHAYSSGTVKEVVKTEVRKTYDYPLSSEDSYTIVSDNGKYIVYDTRSIKYPKDFKLGETHFVSVYFSQELNFAPNVFKGYSLYSIDGSIDFDQKIRSNYISIYFLDKGVASEKYLTKDSLATVYSLDEAREYVFNLAYEELISNEFNKE